jgi:hypothetical protein
LTFAAARPLDPDLRDPFLRAVANALQGSKVIGPAWSRTCAELQRQFFDPLRRFGQVRVTRKNRRPESCAKFFAPLLSGRAPGG